MHKDDKEKNAPAAAKRRAFLKKAGKATVGGAGIVALATLKPRKASANYVPK